MGPAGQSQLRKLFAFREREASKTSSFIIETTGLMLKASCRLLAQVISKQTAFLPPSVTSEELSQSLQDFSPPSLAQGPAGLADIPRRE